MCIRYRLWGTYSFDLSIWAYHLCLGQAFPIGILSSAYRHPDEFIWSTETDHATPEAYLSTYQSFSVSIEREGKLIYFGGDDTVSQLAGDVRSDITAIPFEEHPGVEKDGQTFLHTRYGDYPVRIPNRYFLINLNAARLACRQLGVKDADFYQALSEYSLSLPIW